MSTEKKESVIKKTATQTTDTIKKALDKADEFMNRPEVEETIEKVEDVVKEKAVKAARTIRTRVSEVSLEIFGLNVTVDTIQKAVKADASARNLKGNIKIYVKAEEFAAYYTVNGIGSKEYKVDLGKLL